MASSSADISLTLLQYFWDANSIQVCAVD